MNLKDLESRLKYQFYNINNLKQALTHRSYGLVHNERLEFLGDSILNFSITSMIFAQYKSMNEGNLSRLRANLVNQSFLEKIAINLDLPKYIRLGNGEIKSGGNYRSSILSDAVEAIFGAVFEDSGFRSAYNVIINQYTYFLHSSESIHFQKDSKSFLQEFLQRKGMSLPKYALISSHCKEKISFEVECTIPSIGIKTYGIGKTRRSAEQHAAYVMIESLQKNTKIQS